MSKEMTSHILQDAQIRKKLSGPYHAGCGHMGKKNNNKHLTIGSIT